MTTQPSVPRLLHAGPITVKLEDGELRYLYVGQKEIVRRVYFAVRDGQWKLIGNAWDTTHNANGKERIKLFLSDLAQDIGEKHNFAADHPDIVERLSDLHDQWVRKVTESRGKPVPE